MSEIKRFNWMGEEMKEGVVIFYKDHAAEVERLTQKYHTEMRVSEMNRLRLEEYDLLIQNKDDEIAALTGQLDVSRSIIIQLTHETKEMEMKKEQAEKELIEKIENLRSDISTKERGEDELLEKINNLKSENAALTKALEDVYSCAIQNNQRLEDLNCWRGDEPTPASRALCERLFGGGK